MLISQISALVDFLLDGLSVNDITRITSSILCDGLHLQGFKEENIADGTTDTRRYALRRRALNLMKARHGFRPKVMLNVKSISKSVEKHYCMPSFCSLVPFLDINDESNKCKVCMDALKNRDALNNLAIQPFLQ